MSLPHSPFSPHACLCPLPRNCQPRGRLRDQHRRLGTPRRDLGRVEARTGVIGQVAIAVGENRCGTDVGAAGEGAGDDGAFSFAACEGEA